MSVSVAKWTIAHAGPSGPRAMQRFIGLVQAEAGWVRFASWHPNTMEVPRMLVPSSVGSLGL